MRTRRAALVCLNVLLLFAASGAVPRVGATEGSTDAPEKQRDSPQTQPPQQQDAAPAPVVNDETDGVLIATRRSLRATTEWLARGVDSWFGDTPFEKGGDVTHGRLSVHTLKRESESVDSTLRFSARFRLPNVERRAYAFVGRDNERELVTDTPGELTRQERLLEERPEDQSFFAGLGVRVRDSLDARIGFRGGLKPYAQVRYRKPWHIGEAGTVEFRETLFWTLDDRLGATTSLSFERELSPQLSARWSNSATISQEQSRFQWSSVAGLYRAFGNQRELSLELLALGRRGDPVTVAEYGTQAKWLQPVHKDGLLAEFIVGHFWPRASLETPRRRSWAVGAGLRLLF